MIGLIIFLTFQDPMDFYLILRNENYLFVDGRYTLQASKQSESILKL